MEDIIVVGFYSAILVVALQLILAFFRGIDRSILSIKLNNRCCLCLRRVRDKLSRNFGDVDTISCIQAILGTTLIILASQWGFYYVRNMPYLGSIVRKYEGIGSLCVIIASISILEFIFNYLKLNMTPKQKASLRLLASIYSMVLLLCYRESFGEIFVFGYFLLTLGRFVSYDAQIQDIIDFMLVIVKNWFPITVLLIFTFFMENYLITPSLITKYGFSQLFITMHFWMLIGMEIGVRIIHSDEWTF